jgi:ABC-2 type transport system ATP-binding protein
VRRLNTELEVTIFLTTQYLEEADALAGRVGIIDSGRLVAEGSPEALKRQVGNDLIVVEVADSDPGDAEPGANTGTASAVAKLENLPTVTSVARHGSELSVSSTDGAGLVNDLVVALNQSNVRVQGLTLRTPTLDDVFLAVTGHRIGPGDAPAPAEGEQV